MGEMEKSTRERKASCSCGKLTVTTHGEPLEVSACSCLDCQRRSGSAFTYIASYSDTAVSIAGDRKAWRSQSDSGRWVESNFCPTCGVTVCFLMEAFPETTGVCVGCFADSNFVKPEGLYWASRHHRWLVFPEGIKLLETETA
jgi:hypothetical protein